MITYITVKPNQSARLYRKQQNGLLTFCWSVSLGDTLGLDELKRYDTETPEGVVPIIAARLRVGPSVYVEHQCYLDCAPEWVQSRLRDKRVTIPELDISNIQL